MRFPAPFRAPTSNAGMWSSRPWTVDDVLQVARYKGFFAASPNQFGVLQLNARYVWHDESARFCMEQLARLYRQTVEGKDS